MDQDWEPRFRTDRGMEKLSEESLEELGSIDDGRLILSLGEFVVGKMRANPT